jgi:ABC-2 type transport system ATP-binding protein
MDASSQEMLQVAGLNKRYGEDEVLAAVAFSVRAGEVLGLIGPNGARKTTLLEAIAGLVPVDSETGVRPLRAHRRRSDPR